MFLKVTQEPLIFLPFMRVFAKNGSQRHSNLASDCLAYIVYLENSPKKICAMIG